MDFARPQVEVNPRKGLYTRELLDNSLHFQ